MTENLVWDEAGTREFETGVSRGTLFPMRGKGVPWNGLVSVVINPLGGDIERYYHDGVKYMERTLAEEFQATIQAISTPKEFEPCEGIRDFVPGMKTHFNKREKFHMTWRTQIGNDQDPEVAYKLHVAYNCLVQPASRSYQTIGTTVTPDTRTFVITATPACGPHSYFTFDSRENDLSDLEALLSIGQLPHCWELPNLLSGVQSNCPSLIEPYDIYAPGENVDDDKLVEECNGEVFLYGKISNGIDITDIPVTTDFEANDSDATVVGSGNVLADDDDATYITSSDGDLGYTIGLTDLLDYPEGARIELHLRMSVSGGVNEDDPDNLDADAQVFITTDADGDLEVGGFSDGTDEGMGFRVTDVDGNIVDYTVPLYMDSWVDSSIEAVVTALTAGAYLNVVGVTNNNTEDTPEVRVYEAYLSVVDTTDKGKYLRARDIYDSGWTELHIYDNESDFVDLETSLISSVDFKIQMRGHDTDADGNSQDIINWSPTVLTTSPAARLTVGGDGAPQLDIYGAGDVLLNSLVLETNKWYTLSTKWTWHEMQMVLLERDTKYILDTGTYATTEEPIAFAKFFAGYFGSADPEKTYEVSIDNPTVNANCQDVQSLVSINRYLWRSGYTPGPDDGLYGTTSL